MKPPTIIWRGARPKRDIVDRVVAEMTTQLATGLRAPENLIFHVVLLSENLHGGPEVVVWGVKGDPNFYAEYHAGEAA